MEEYRRIHSGNTAIHDLQLQLNPLINKLHEKGKICFATMDHVRAEDEV